ncbi:hypothetical protein QQS21_010664 [Conoideocrella luteorostrata]|uniref:Uncharacterized protein n=1 Tax=Conoideocrella luteorostrata TaxID=1105319 RepID=A0AAJ0CEK5_9HYPO|nr:hypothetical protein QQS21_010664 [Conoideocrella luteorostrata]
MTDPTDGERRMRQHRSRSDELMEELELQLGETYTQLMNIKVSYLHSAFPKINMAESIENGLCHLQSRMETTATAALVRNGNSSIWSPRSKVSQNSLFPLMVQHWGDEKAIEIQRRISDSQMMPRLFDARPQSANDDTPRASRGSAANGNTDFFNENLPLKFHRLDKNFTSDLAAEAHWKTWCGQGTDIPLDTSRGLKTPIRDIYYFGERAIKALGTPTKFDSKRINRNTSSTKEKIIQDSKYKDSRFWDWGSWF